MSGLEIVGVILGAVPIIISAIDHYKTTSQRVKYFRYREPHIVELIRSLEEQRFFLESDLVETLQKSTDLEADEISAWLQNPNSELFEDPEITDAVREYLGEGYPQYTGAIDRCQRIIEEIAKDINGLTCAQVCIPLDVLSIRPSLDLTGYAMSGTDQSPCYRKSPSHENQRIRIREEDQVQP